MIPSQKGQGQRLKFRSLPSKNVKMFPVRTKSFRFLPRVWDSMLINFTAFLYTCDRQDDPCMGMMKHLLSLIFEIRDRIDRNQVLLGNYSQAYTSKRPIRIQVLPPPNVYTKSTNACIHFAKSFCCLLKGTPSRHPMRIKSEMKSVMNIAFIMKFIIEEIAVSELTRTCVYCIYILVNYDRNKFKTWSDYGLNLYLNPVLKHVSDSEWKCNIPI